MINMDLLQSIAMSKINKKYKHKGLGFTSIKAFRKQSINDEEFQKMINSNDNQKIINSYLGYTYIIYWAKEYGITSYIFNNQNKGIAYSGYTYKNADILEYNTRKYIEYIIKIIND